MAKTVVGLEIAVDSTGAATSVKSLKAQLKEAQADVQVLSEKFGATSKEAVEAAKKAAGLKDAIGDAKALTDAYNPDAKFKAFGAAIQGVVGGFSALQGAQALFGSESEDLQKTLVKVQGAMALSQGIDALTEARDSFKTLGKQAIETFNKIKTAIGSSGIGLLVVALGAIYAYWDDIKGAISGVSDEQNKLLETQKKSVAASEKSLDSISKSENILKLQGKSEKDILNLKIAATKTTITQLEAQLTSQKTMRKSQIDAAKRNKDILEGILKFITAPIAILLKSVDQVGKVLGKDFGLEEKLYGGIAKMVFDPEEVATEADKAIAETENKLNELKNSQAGYQLQIQQINKDAAKKAADDQKKKDADAEELRKKREAEEKARLENLVAQNKHTDELIQQNRLSAIKDAFFKRQAELATQEQKEIDDELDRLNNKLITQEQYEINRNNIVAKYANLQSQLLADEEKKRADEANKKLIDEAALDLQRANNQDLSFQERLQAIQERENSINSIVFESEAAKTEFEKQNADARIKIAQEEANQKVATTKAIGDAMGQLSEIIGKETAVGKGLAVAQATINTWLGATEVLRAKSTLPEPVGTISKIVNVAAIVASGIKSVKSILSTKVPGGGGGGSAPSMPSAPLTPQVATTNINQGQVNQLASATSRAFVLESDVSGSQERIRRINRAARIN